MFESSNLNISYKVNTEHLYKLKDNDLINWEKNIKVKIKLLHWTGFIRIKVSFLIYQVIKKNQNKMEIRNETII